MNGLSSLDETYWEYYSLHTTDDLIRFWGSKVEVTACRWSQILWTPCLMNYLSSLN